MGHRPTHLGCHPDSLAAKMHEHACTPCAHTSTAWRNVNELKNQSTPAGTHASEASAETHQRPPAKATHRDCMSLWQTTYPAADLNPTPQLQLQAQPCSEPSTCSSNSILLHPHSSLRVPTHISAASPSFTQAPRIFTVGATLPSSKHPSLLSACQLPR
jgi:hypothetical protein